MPVLQLLVSAVAVHLIVTPQGIIVSSNMRALLAHAWCWSPCCLSLSTKRDQFHASLDPASVPPQDSEEDYEEDEDGGADDDGEYGDGEGDPCPNCGRKYRWASASIVLLYEHAAQLFQDLAPCAVSCIATAMLMQPSSRAGLCHLYPGSCDATQV